MRRKALLLAVIIALAAGLVPTAAWGRSAPDDGVAFVPRPGSKALYGTKSPDQDPETQRHYVEGHDGVDLYVETWLPAPKDGHKPPSKIPTVLIMTPYVSQGVEEYPSNPPGGFIAYMTARGYAVAQHHVRGTGESGGCLEQTAANQWDDGARVVEYLGKEAPWSNGRVGMYGISYDGETQVSTAGLGDPKRTKYLKAIVPAASVGSQYDWNFMDGVNWVGQPLIGNSAYLGGVSLIPGQEPAPQHYPEKMDCQGDVMSNSFNFTGDYTQYWKDRELRPGAPHVKAATLYVHGLRDFNVQDITIAGWFDRLPESTPHKGLFGVWNHAFPDAHSSVEPEWARADWMDMVTAWYDRYLKGLDTDVEKWPDVQVQSSDGQWWTAGHFAKNAGYASGLALGADGLLGATKPTDSTTFIEQLGPDNQSADERAVFETPKLKKPLHITGQPVADLWLTTDKPDGHVAVSLQVVNDEGAVATHAPGSYQHATYGVRSLMHLEPMERGWFAQELGVEPPVNEPIRVPVRFLPTDLVVPKGGRLRLTISGSVSYNKGDSQPSGSRSTITLLHDCRHQSTLRFLIPRAGGELINVRETDEANVKNLRSKPQNIGTRDGVGLARAEVCGEYDPIQPETAWQ
ncbi:MAG: CocE/NonD family hydrolase [Actinomycetota bacterium]